MRTISYMYMVSGGCNYHHSCKGCINCQKAMLADGNGFSRKRDSYVCLKHPEQAAWNPDWLACRWYSDAVTVKKPSSSRRGKKTENVHQMTIMELLGAEA